MSYLLGHGWIQQEHVLESTTDFGQVVVISVAGIRHWINMVILQSLTEMNKQNI